MIAIVRSEYEYWKEQQAAKVKAMTDNKKEDNIESELRVVILKVLIEVFNHHLVSFDSDVRELPKICLEKIEAEVKKQKQD